MTSTRRTLFALAVAAAVACAAPAAFAAEKLIDAAKVFAYLENFLKVPAAERTRIRVAYGVVRDGKPPQGLQAWFVSPTGARTPVGIGAGGVFERLPTLAELKGKIAFNVDDSVKLGTRLELHPNLRPSQEFDARELSATLVEANKVIAKAAGPMALMAPKMARLSFVGAPSGVAVMADGRTVPLEVVKGSAVFNPAATPAAVRVKLVKAPSRVAFMQKP